MSGERRKYGLILFFSLLGVSLFSQQTSGLEQGEDNEYLNVIPLEEVYVLSPLRFTDSNKRNDYYRLRIRVLKVFGYAVLAQDRLEQIEMRLSEIDRKREKRVYTKRLKSFFEKELTAELKKLSRKDGQILIKLVNRQTGIDAFEIVKNYRNGWTAFWYQTAASANKMNLKQSYDPYMSKEDYWIEDILQRAFTRGILPNREAKQKIDLAKMEAIWINPSSKK